MFTILRWITVGPIVAVAAVLLLNCIDRSLRPEVEAYARPAASQSIPPDKNAYYAMLGFLAPPDADAHAFGQSAAAKYEDFLRHSPQPEAFDVYEGIARSDLRDWPKPVCVWWYDASCLDAALEQRNDIQQALVSNEFLLRRYTSLYAYQAYTNPLTPHLSNPIGSVSVMSTQALWLAGQALRARDGELNGALTALSDDLRFWRWMAAQPVNLLDKVLALTCIARDVRLLSDLLRVVAFDAAQLQRGLEMLEPLNAEEKSLAIPIREEFRLMYRTLREVDILDDPMVAAIPDAFGFVKRPFYQRNHTSNRLYAIFQEYTRLAAMPPAEYLVQREAVLERHRQENDFHSWKSLYNPIGRILLSTAAPGMPYPGRVHDIDGLMRLVTLQVQMRQAGVKSESVSDFLGRAGSAHVDPYTGRPMNWDPKQQRLSFTGHGRTEGASIWVQL